MRKIVIVLVALASIALVFFALQKRSEDRVADLESRPLFSDAQRAVFDGLQRIELQRGPQRVELVNADGGWGVASHDLYPAQRERIAALLHALRGVRIVEDKTDNPAHHALLGLDPDADDSSALQVHLSNGNDQLSLVYGNTVGNGQLVRLGDGDQVWLVNRPFNISVNAQDWLALNVISLPMERLATARWEYADGEVIELDKAGDGAYNFRLADVPEQEQAGNERLVNSMVLELVQLQAQDVALRSELELDEPLVRMQLATFGDGRLHASLYESEGKYWLLIDGFEAGTESSLRVHDDPRWAYQLTIGQVENLTKRRDDLIVSDTAQ